MEHLPLAACGQGCHRRQVGTVTLQDCLFAGTFYGSAAFHPIAVKYSQDPLTFTAQRALYTAAAAPTLTEADRIAAPGALASAITADPDVSMDFGQGTHYSVPDMTACGGALCYGGAYLAGEGDQVALSLSCQARESACLAGYAASAGALAHSPDGWMLTMPGESVMIRSVWAPLFGQPDFTLPAEITAIEEEAFAGAAMTVAVIPESCGSIGPRAFHGCESLFQIRIPADCAVLDDAFDGCTLVYVYGTSGSSAEAYCDTHDNCLFVDENMNW